MRPMELTAATVVVADEEFMVVTMARTRSLVHISGGGALSKIVRLWWSTV